MSNLKAVASALVTTLRAASGMSAPSGTGVPVFDGITPDGRALPDFVVVGLSDPNGGGPAFSYTADWASYFTDRSREESGEIACVAVAQSGDTDTATVRNRVVDLLDACEAALTAAPQLGGAPAGLMWAHLTSADVDVEQSDAGCFATARFTVSYRGLFGPVIA